MHAKNPCLKKSLSGTRKFWMDLAPSEKMEDQTENNRRLVFDIFIFYISIYIYILNMGTYISEIIWSSGTLFMSLNLSQARLKSHFSFCPFSYFLFNDIVNDKTALVFSPLLSFSFVLKSYFFPNMIDLQSKNRFRIFIKND